VVTADGVGMLCGGATGAAWYRFDPGIAASRAAVCRLKRRPLVSLYPGLT